MNGTTTAKKNGRTAPGICRHSPNCEVAQTQRDLQAQVLKVGEDLGLALEKIEERLNSMALHLSNVSQLQVTGSEREAEWLRQLGEMTRAVAALGGDRA